MNTNLGNITPAIGFQANQSHDKKSTAESFVVHKVHDQLLPKNPLVKIRAGVEQAAYVPQYAVRGLKGDPDSNFFEYLKLGKVPYYIGGPALVATTLAFLTKGNPQANQGVLRSAKKLGAGVVLYYLAASAAKAVIDTPVKWFRGVDLNHKYKDIVDLRATSPTGVSPKKKEYHGVFDSVDFTRWDLLYNNHQSRPELVNKYFNKIAQKYGIDQNMNDSDSTVKTSIKKTIIMSRAWKYALTIPFVATAIGLSVQEPWENIGKTIVKDVKEIFNPAAKISLKVRADKAVKVATQNFLKPLADSFAQLWKGQGLKSGIAGKALILASGLGSLYANYSILDKTSAESEKVVDLG